MSTGINETVGTSESENKSLTSFRVVNCSSPGDLPKLDTKKSAALMCDTEGKTCANSSKIPRPPLTPSYSFNETLKSNKSKGKTKKTPSMIPRSKSRKRNESDKVKFDIPSKTECLKNQLKDASVLRNRKSNCGLVERESRTALPPNVTPSKSYVVQEKGEKHLGQKLIDISSVSLKSCHDFVEVTKRGSDTSYKDAQEDSLWDCLGGRLISRKDQEIDGHSRSFKPEEDKEKDEREAVRQDRNIRHLYETIKCTFGPVFDNFRRTVPENAEVKNDFQSVPDISSIQGHYEFTLKEISSIWKNTISLIGSVRDHAVKFVEDNNKSIDKEQLLLEAEMLQLALDFAISYSKLKTDFLIKLVRKRLNVKNLGKSELENFMDAKTFAALYNNDDLAAMARTVQDLNTSLLKGEDLELE